MRRIEDANAEALKRMLSADLVLVDVIPAVEAIPALKDRMILHAGPPIDWTRMCGPMQGAVTGIAVFEEWASDLEEAATMAADGAFDFRCSRSHDGYDHRKPATDGCRKPDLWKPGILCNQRRARQGHAVWR